MIKKILSRFVLIALVGTLLFLGVKSISNTTKLSADSGFDSSYDSGGSWGGSYDSGSSWSSSSSSDYSWSSSSHNYSSGGSGSYTAFDALIYLVIMAVSFLLSAIKTVSTATSIPYSPFNGINAADSLSTGLYKIFKDVKYNIFHDKIDDIKPLVTDSFYNSIINNPSEIKENIITHDNTRIISEEDNNIVLEFISKASSYKDADGKLTRVNEDVLDKNKYVVEFVKEDSIWKINSIEKTFLQKITYTPSTYNDRERDFKNVDISKYIKDKDLFLKERYEDYVAIQEAWMNFDYNTLKDKLTNELYNQYEMQLETLKAKQEKNIMKSFTNNGITISNVVEENNNVTVNIGLHVSQIDYIEKDGKCVRGKSGKLNNMYYSLKFISSLDDIEKKCPNCGNPLDDISSQTCKYCHSTITFTPKKWVMSKKQVISQR